MSITAWTHLAFLGAVVAYLGYGYPAGLAALLAQFALALVAEWVHPWWVARVTRIVVVREAAFLGGLGLAWFIGTPLYPLIGYALVASLLLLVRQRTLRFLPGLCAADLVWCGVGGTPLAPAALTPSAASLVLVPLAVAALAADGWLGAVIGAKRSVRHQRHAWIMLAVPVGLCALFGLLLGLPAAHRDPEEIGIKTLKVGSPKLPTAAHTGLDTVLRIGDQLRIDRDQAISARLEWNGPPPRLGKMVYLRAICLPQVISEGPFLLWRAQETGFQPLSAPIPARAPTAWLLRRPGSGDAVLRPDGSRGVLLDRLKQDVDGNWYQAGIGRTSITYRVSTEQLTNPELGEASTGQVNDARTVPRDLRDLPWSRIERRTWAEQAAEQAAEGIIAAVQERCYYALDNLPEPDPNPGGALRTFLFSDDQDDRRGHCQYFATAAVILLRRSGHPARAVVGFASEEIDAKGVTFRGIHAHAWLEAVNSRGRWQRFDATPSAGYLQRMAHLDLATAEVALPLASQQLPKEGGEEQDPLTPGTPRTAVAWWPWAVGGGILVSLWFLVRWWFVRPSPEARRKLALVRADDGLFVVAREAGLVIKPATTLAEIADFLTRRSGIELSGHLSEHLAARYGAGPLPRPWPVAAIRHALKRLKQ